jgi:hypothetical protein
MTQSIDGARLTLILNKLRLPAIKQDWTAFAERADKESWPAADRVAWILCLYIKGVQRRSAWRGAKKPSVLPYSVPYQNGWNFWRTFNTLILRSFHWNWPGYPCNAVTTAPSHPGIGSKDGEICCLIVHGNQPGASRVAVLISLGNKKTSANVVNAVFRPPMNKAAPLGTENSATRISGGGPVLEPDDVPVAHGRAA